MMAEMDFKINLKIGPAQPGSMTNQ